MLFVLSLPRAIRAVIPLALLSASAITLPLIRTTSDIHPLYITWQEHSSGKDSSSLSQHRPRADLHEVEPSIDP